MSTTSNIDSGRMIIPISKYFQFLASLGQRGAPGLRIEYLPKLFPTHHSPPLPICRNFPSLLTRYGLPLNHPCELSKKISTSPVAVILILSYVISRGPGVMINDESIPESSPSASYTFHPCVGTVTDLVLFLRQLLCF